MKSLAGYGYKSILELTPSQRHEILSVAVLDMGYSRLVLRLKNARHAIESHEIESVGRILTEDIQWLSSLHRSTHDVLHSV